ncbi:MAG TPA: hypothetical protein DD379_15285 [Cyanobacteria bacterium UBA11162]|nr:hypothetical protein [Cyanobacteria bacterium UBA11162]
MGSGEENLVYLTDLKTAMSTNAVAVASDHSTFVIAQESFQGFVTPSGNIYCGGDENALRCEIQSRLNRSVKLTQSYLSLAGWS